MNYMIPPEFSDTKSYELYKEELLAWRLITDLDKSKQGVAVAYGLPEQGRNGIRQRVFIEMGTDQLNADDGLKKLMDFLNKHLGIDDVLDRFEKYSEFDDFERKDNQSISEYISEFDCKYANISKKNVALLPEILAFKLLKGANLSKEGQRLVLTDMNFEINYEQAKNCLKQFQDGPDCIQNQELAINRRDVKVEPTLLISPSHPPPQLAAPASNVNCTMTTTQPGSVIPQNDRMYKPDNLAANQQLPQPTTFYPGNQQLPQPTTFYPGNQVQQNQLNMMPQQIQQMQLAQPSYPMYGRPMPNVYSNYPIANYGSNQQMNPGNWFNGFRG